MKAAFAIAVGSFLVLALLGFQSVESQTPQDGGQPIAEPDAGAGEKAVECRWRAGEIELDGDINERAWKNADPLELRVPWENRQSKTSTHARLLWDWDYLYFCAKWWTTISTPTC